MRTKLAAKQGSKTITAFVAEQSEREVCSNFAIFASFFSLLCFNNNSKRGEGNNST